MSKILIEGNKVIIDGHASDLETCNTLTNLCDELSTSEKFRTVKYESGYGEFESVSENEEKKFAADPGTVTLYIKSNDGLSTLYSNLFNGGIITITTTGVSWQSNGVYPKYIYYGSKVFLGLSNTPNATVAKYTYGDVHVDEYNPNVGDFSLYIVEEDPGYQVNVNSNDGTTTLAQNAIVDSVVVTSTGAQLKYGDTVNATYTYSGSKLFAGLSTSANAIATKYKPGDTIKITAETTFYIVENIIIPEHHSSLTELFTNIATVIREKTGDTASIIADDFPSVIRDRLKVKPLLPPIGTVLNDMTWEDIRKISDLGLASSYFNIGDRKAVYLNGTAGSLSLNGTYYCYIIGIDHNSEIEGKNRIHFQFGFDNLTGGSQIAFTDDGYGSGHTSGSYFNMNNSMSNNGGWANSRMRTTIIPTFKACLPSDLQAVLKTVTKYSDNIGGVSNSASNVTATTDDIFLLAEREVFGARKFANKAEQNYQAQYAYYFAGNSKVRYQHSSTETNCHWWLRSVYAGTSDRFCRCNKSAEADVNIAHASQGFAPCFCV